MQLKRWFSEVMREKVVVELQTYTGEGTEEPVTRLGVPYDMGENKKKAGEMYVRMLVTHEEVVGDDGKKVTVPLDSPKFRTVPLFKVVDDSPKRRRDLEYTEVKV